MRKMTRVRLFCILVGSVLAAFLVPLAARAWLASPRPVEAPAMDIRTWDTKWQVISENVYTDSMQFYPAVAVVSPTVCVAWSRQMADNEEYYDPHYKISSQNGELGQWGGQVNIHPLSTKTDRVDVAVDSGEGLHFVWSEYTKSPYTYTLYYSSTQISITDPQLVTQFDGILVPAIAVGDSKVHVVWSQGANSIKYDSKSTSSGAWGSPANIVSAWAIQPGIAVDGAGKVHVVWSEGAADSSADIFYANSSDGSVWSAPFEVSSDAGNGGRSPAIAVSGSNVYVVWTEWINKETQYIRFRQSGDGGNNWGGSFRLSGSFAANQDSPNFLRPAIALDSTGKLHVAFNGAGATSDPENIYYASKTQIGSWLCCRNLTSNVIGNNTTPDIAASGEDVHLVWAGPPPPYPGDLEQNDYEVLYKRTITLEEGGLYLPLILKSY